MDYHARFYKPSLGRFTQPDTIVPEPTSPQSFDRYAYVSNNPVKYIDPSGQGQCTGLLDETCRGDVGAIPVPDGPPDGLNDGGQLAWQGLMNLIAAGFPNNVLALLAFVIGSEYGPYIDGKGFPQLDEAIARKYYQYCSDGPWTAACLNGFWAYFEAILASAQSVEAAKAQIERVCSQEPEYRRDYDNLAQAILHPGDKYGRFTMDPSVTKDCSNIDYCHWATITSANGDFYIWLKDMWYFFKSAIVSHLGDGSLFIVLSWKDNKHLYALRNIDDYNYNLTSWTVFPLPGTMP
ncbi:MAG: hypothetical protein OEZ02_06465 [Anaerolineae bacterium]|nr:hypothetical protein [Anaerolineae bacterium]